MSHAASRLLSLLSLLQMPRTWSGAELAQRLEVSSRTIRNDVGRLRELGYAVEGTRGGEGGYRMGRGGSSVPPLLLDPEEATAVAVGLRTGLNCIIGGMEETSARALAKLEQTLPARVRHRVQNLNRFTVPLSSNRPMRIVDPSILTMIVGLCQNRERLRFTYTLVPRRGEPGSNSYERREVEPYRLVNRQHRWYLLAFDPSEGAWTVFRVDRIEPHLPAGARFAPRELPAKNIGDYVQRNITEHMWRLTATVTAYTPASRIVDKLTAAEGTVEPIDDGSCVLTMGAESLRTIALTLARLDVDFTIVTPDELREEVRHLANRLTLAAGA